MVEASGPGVAGVKRYTASCILRGLCLTMIDHGLGAGLMVTCLPTGFHWAHNSPNPNRHVP